VILMATGGGSGGGYVCSQGLLYGIYVGLLVMHGIVNSFGGVLPPSYVNCSAAFDGLFCRVCCASACCSMMNLQPGHRHSSGTIRNVPIFAVRFVGMLSIISTIWHVIGTFVIVALVSAVAPTHQSAHYVFTSLNVPDVGISNHGYVFFLGLLMSQFCITGCAAAQSCTQRSGSPCQKRSCCPCTFPGCHPGARHSHTGSVPAAMTPART